MSHVKSIIKSMIPPAGLCLWEKLVICLGFATKFDGDYPSWEAAQQASSGYDAPEILEVVRKSGLKVKHGEAAFERDSVCFDQEEYRWPTLACLLQVAAQSEGQLNVLDFGGSLGSFYFQHKKFLSKISQLHWSVVEQPEFVACGRKEFEDDALKFYMSPEECLANVPVNVILASSVLPYLKEPYAVLESLCALGVRSIVIDRMPFISGDKDRLTIQNISMQIYNARFPAWFFSKACFLKAITSHGYRVVAEFPCDDQVNVKSEFKGLLLEKT